MIRCRFRPEVPIGYHLRTRPENVRRGRKLTPQGKFVQVALPVPLRQTFTYRIPPALIGEIGVGARIIVPFGKRMLTGYAVSFTHEPPAGNDFDLDSIKNVSELIDPEPMITYEVMDLAEWVADYYAGSLGEVLKASLPAGINAAMERFVTATVEGRRALGSSVGKKALKWKILRSVAETDEVSTKDLEGDFGSGATRAVRELERDGLVNVTLRRSASHVRPKRRKAVRLLSSNDDGGRALTEPQERILDSLSAAGGSMLFTELLESAEVGASPINTLAKRGLLEVTTEEVLRDPLAGAEIPESAGIVLNPGQAGDPRRRSAQPLNSDNYSSFLLHGVTGSGKTEVYIRAMTNALRSGKKLDDALAGDRPYSDIFAAAAVRVWRRSGYPAFESFAGRAV
jgi:primosomal protein N' (replication factor Y) (superfamily II helicase)